MSVLQFTQQSHIKRSVQSYQRIIQESIKLPLQSQGRESPNASSPDALVAFYKDMEQKEIVERKLSKRKSNSIWSRKSVKRSTAPAANPPAQKHHLPSEEQDERRRGEEEREMEGLEEQKDTIPRALDAPRSIIPDTAKDLPDWYNKEAWSSPLPTFKLKYNLHNPVGPRWYKNHHLIPPAHIRPATRPPSVFSPSFPPMASSTLQDRSEDSTRLQGPSRTPSNSPLPTPNSSQTRVEDSGGRPRSRKSSQTAHDNVDLLDVTDPWGTNWHHHSPYDIGLSNGPISVDVQDVSMFIDKTFQSHLFWIGVTNSCKAFQYNRCAESKENRYSIAIVSVYFCCSSPQP